MMWGSSHPGIPSSLASSSVTSQSQDAQRTTLDVGPGKEYGSSLPSIHHIRNHATLLPFGEVVGGHRTVPGWFHRPEKAESASPQDLRVANPSLPSRKNLLLYF